MNMTQTSNNNNNSDSNNNNDANKTNVLVLNCGSSSIKFAVVDPVRRQMILTGRSERLNSPEALLTWSYQGQKTEKLMGQVDHYAALQQIIALLQAQPDLGALIAIGHRVLHGGHRFMQATLVTDEVERTVEEYAAFGPLHNPANLLGIRAAKRAFSQLPQVAVFDTAFHQTMPDYAYSYALPYPLAQEHHLRKYGFHGTSHRYVSQRALELLQLPPADSRLVIAHLGNGCSVSAVLNGRSVDTSMGLTPLEGLMMGTRCGDIDPSIVFFLVNKLGMTIAEVDHLLNKQSGLLGMSQVGSDMRSVLEAAAQGQAAAQLAVEMFCYRAAKYIASYLVPLGRLDALVFTGGIGENSVRTRAKILQYLAGLQFKLDSQRNYNNGVQSHGIITQEGSYPIAAVVPTNEELMIAIDTKRVVDQLNSD